MRIRDLFKGLTYVGQTAGDRNRYHVFENASGFLVVATNATRANAYNVNWVDRDAVDFVQRTFKGRKTTTSKIMQKARRRKAFSRGFVALNALYAMAAAGHAKRLKERDGRAMVFRIATQNRQRRTES